MLRPGLRIQLPEVLVVSIHIRPVSDSLGNVGCLSPLGSSAVDRAVTAAPSASGNNRRQFAIRRAERKERLHEQIEGHRRIASLHFSNARLAGLDGPGETHLGDASGLASRLQATQMSPQSRRHNARRLKHASAHRRKPICSASASLSAGLRRSSITRRSASEKLKNASISKALSSRARDRRPRHVDCLKRRCGLRRGRSHRSQAQPSQKSSPIRPLWRGWAGDRHRGRWATLLPITADVSGLVTQPCKRNWLAVWLSYVCGRQYRLDNKWLSTGR